MEGRLEQACGTGEIVTIVYRGGTQPGTKRDILARRVVGDVVQALDLATQEIRSFRLDRMEIVAHDAPFPAYVAGGGERFASLDQVHAGLMAELSRLGWHVVASTDRLGLHAPTTKGKPSRRPSITLRHKTGAARPWVIKTPYRFQRSFSSLDRAARFFLSEAHGHSRSALPAESTDTIVVNGTIWPDADQGAPGAARPGLWLRVKRALGFGEKV